MKTLALIACFALSASAVFAQEATESEEPTIEKLVTLIEENGCTMEEADAEALLTPHGFTMEITSPMMDQLIADGTAVIEGTAVTLKTEACP